MFKNVRRQAGREEKMTFTDWLEHEIKKQGWSMRELARRANISHSWVANVMSGQAPSWDFCAAIASPLQISPVAVLLLANKLTPSDVRRALPALPDHEISTSDKLVAVVRELDEEDQKALLRLTRNLVPNNKLNFDQP